LKFHQIGFLPPTGRIPDGDKSLTPGGGNGCPRGFLGFNPPRGPPPPVVRGQAGPSGQRSQRGRGGQQTLICQGGGKNKTGPGGWFLRVARPSENRGEFEQPRRGGAGAGNGGETWAKNRKRVPGAEGGQPGGGGVLVPGRGNGAGASLNRFKISPTPDFFLRRNRL